MSMSDLANWSYTARATLWHNIGENDETGKIEFAEPIIIECDYGSDTQLSAGSLGREVVIKNTIYTEYAAAKKGDYVLIGESVNVDPFAAGADEIVHILRYADTFERQRDDYVLITKA